MSRPGPARAWRAFKRLLSHHHRKDHTMGNPNQIIDESPVADADSEASAGGVDQSAIDAAVDAAVAKFADEHGIQPPTPEVKQSALAALQELEHTTFGEKLKALAEKGIQEAELASETPIVRALAAIVGELATHA